MTKLFEKTKIKSLTMPNRFVRSATYEEMANPDGSPSPLLINTMVKLAKGGVGLIITGLTPPQKTGRAVPLQLQAHSDEVIPGLSKMTSAVHDAGGRIALQIAHAGA